MARFKKKGRRSGKSKSIPLAVVAPLVAIGYEAGKDIMAGNMAELKWDLVAVNAEGKFSGQKALQIYGPLAAGVVIHKVANKVGVNNIVRRASMGYLSI